VQTGAEFATASSGLCRRPPAVIFPPIKEDGEPIAMHMADQIVMRSGPDRDALGRVVDPYARNARTHSDEQVAQIAASIREFGFTVPLLEKWAKGIDGGPSDESDDEAVVSPASLR
jgi:hypothetical protein